MTIRKIDSIAECFSKLRDNLLEENAVIELKLSQGNMMIKELNKIMLQVLSKSSASLQNLKEIILSLCKQISFYNPHDSILFQAKKVVDKQEQDWSYFQTIIKSKVSKIGSCEKKGQAYEGNVRNVKQSGFIPAFNPSRSYRQYKNTESKYSVQNGPQIPDINDKGVNYKLRLREEFSKIKQFIQRQFVPKLQVDADGSISKKMMLNSYIQWNNRQGRVRKIMETGKIQMQLTNQMRLAFPKVRMSKHFIRGIRFNFQDTDEQNLTDRTLIRVDCGDQIDEDYFTDQIYSEPVSPYLAEKKNGDDDQQ